MKHDMTKFKDVQKKHWLIKSTILQQQIGDWQLKLTQCWKLQILKWPLESGSNVRWVHAGAAPVLNFTKPWVMLNWGQGHFEWQVVLCFPLTGHACLCLLPMFGWTGSQGLLALSFKTALLKPWTLYCMYLRPASQPNQRARDRFPFDSHSVYIYPLFQK